MPTPNGFTGLKIQGVSKTFTSTNGVVESLEHVNLEVKPGEFVSLVGPSGCGKTTLLNIIAGLELPTEGKVLINDEEIQSTSPDRLMIFQELGLFPWLTVRKNIEFGLKAKGIPQEERQDIAQTYLKMVHLQRFQDLYPHELSGGMRQRVALARALAMNPQVLLMDEPFASLDAQTRDILHDELQRIWQKTHKTILFVTHNVREAVCLGDRILVFATRPGHIKKEFHVDLPRPRQKENPHVAITARAIQAELQVEVEKVVKEELDYDWTLQKGVILPSADHDLGSGI